MKSQTVEDLIKQHKKPMSIVDKNQGWAFWISPETKSIGGKMGRDKNGKIIML